MKAKNKGKLKRLLEGTVFFRYHLWRSLARLRSFAPCLAAGYFPDCIALFGFVRCFTSLGGLGWAHP